MWRRLETAYFATIAWLRKCSHRADEPDISAAQLRAVQCLVRVTGIGAIAGLLGVLVIIGALIITKQAADDAHIALVASNRAWVGPVGATMNSMPTEPNAKITISMAFRNTGHEPAVKTSISLDSDTIVTTPVDDVLLLERKYANTCLSLTFPRTQSFVIFPSTAGTNDYNTSMIVNAQKIDRGVIDGTKYLLIQACVIYETFGKLQHSALCYFAQAGNVGPGALPFCDQGNEAD